MAEKSDNPVEELVEKITEKLGGHDSSSSSSDSESDSDSKKHHDSSSAAKAKIFRLFGRERPVHHVLGGGKRKCSFVYTSFF